MQISFVPQSGLRRFQPGHVLPVRAQRRSNHPAAQKIWKDGRTRYRYRQWPWIQIPPTAENGHQTAAAAAAQMKGLTSSLLTSCRRRSLIGWEDQSRQISQQLRHSAAKNQQPIQQTLLSTTPWGRKKGTNCLFVCISFNTWQKLVNFFVYIKERISYNSVYLALACVKNFA